MHRRQFFIAAALSPFVASSAFAASDKVPAPAKTPAAPVAVVPAKTPAAPDRSPVDIVKYFYAFSAGKSGKWDGPSAFTDAGVRKTSFSKAFLAAIAADEKKSQAAGEIGAIDFDPISASQDPSVKNLAVTSVTATPDKASVKAHFTYEADPKSASADITYDFIREGSGWKLDNIHIKQSASPESEDDLRALLAKGG